MKKCNGKIEFFIDVLEFVAENIIIIFKKMAFNLSEMKS